MRYFLFGLLFVSSIVASIAQGWREGEKQVQVLVTDSSQLTKLDKMNINYEWISSGTIRAYLTLKEQEQLNNEGIDMVVEIEDLNKHFENFWLTEDAYHSYQDIIDLADSLEQEFPAICKKYIYGSSLGGRQLAALKISDNVLTDEPEAEVFFDGGIHGDEIGASENIIRFARDLCVGYGSNSTITGLVDGREIWLYLMVNPDGRVAMSRYNNNGVDLNRDNGYMWDQDGTTYNPFGEVESRALRSCNLENQFVVYTSYHSGTEYVSYPWSYRPNQTNDHAHIHQLAQVYVNQSGYSNLPYGQGYSGMYPINGSTKDSYYGITGDVSWSMEISYNKQPPASQIMTYYNYNKPSMLAMIEYSGYGLQGTITDAVSGDPVAAMVFVNNYHPCYSDPEAGDYHKYVLAGTYSITVKANGYQTQTISGVTVTSGNATTTDFQLIPEQGQYAYKFLISRIPGNNFSDEGFTPASLGPPDNINYSIGKSGYCVLDMQYPVIDGPGFDIVVYEGDATPEGYTCYASQSMDGPWMSMGTGSGTTEFDLSASGLPESRYIKLIDDGDGTATAADAGFDLDAIEAQEPVSGVYLAMYEYHVEDPAGNNNGKIDPGETVDIIVTLKNNGDITAENVQGEISTISPYLTLQTATAGFGNLSQSQTGEGTFTVTASSSTPAGEAAEIGLEVTANNGAYTNNFTMNFIMGQIPVVIIDLDGNQNSGPAILDAIQSNDLVAEYTNSFPADLNLYSSIFLSLGIYSDNHVLSSSEGQALADFLNGGGNLYMEGGDTWYYDDQTAVHTMFNINGESDGSSDLSTISGETGTMTAGMTFSYSGDNNWIDHISAQTPAVQILENQSPVYGTGIAYDAGTYKTIGASHEFGGLTDGASPSTKEELMAVYLEFFGFSSSLQAAFFASVTEICEGNIINFTDASSGDIISWEWTFEGGSPGTSTFQNPTVMYSTAGVYDVSLTVSDGTENSTIVLEDYITVNAIPTTPDKPIGPAMAYTMPGMTNDYTVPVIISADSYVWFLDPPDMGTLIENGNECTVDWTDWSYGTVNLSVKALNECGESEFSESLEIIMMVVDVNENSMNDLRIYPNPADKLISLDFVNISDEIVDLAIYDKLGRTVYEKPQFNTQEVKTLIIDLDDYESGFYMISVSGNNIRINRKIMIR
jgi:hypothetical protein